MFEPTYWSDLRKIYDFPDTLSWRWSPYHIYHRDFKNHDIKPCACFTYIRISCTWYHSIIPFKPCYETSAKVPKKHTWRPFQTK